GAFALASPLIHRYYDDTLQGLCQSNSNLRPPFEFSPWSCCCFNLGKQVRAYRHRDHLNCPFGWCAISALGWFDPKKGGHLVLWDLKLVIEFPPGSTIFIPSALLLHSNLPVRPGEKRFSFVQWSAGALFRWVEFGFRGVKEYMEGRPAKEASVLNEERWRTGMMMMPRLSHFRPE
ncbi:hypothetical protein GLOTRDRAFT_50945, partial [Gloeophyllum trabeum ATCC 11539]